MLREAATLPGSHGVRAMLATDAMTAALYDDLRRVARRERFHAGSPHTLQTTAVIHEAYLKLYRRDGWESREHFLGTAATAMRHVLVDAARARLSAKRGGGVRSLPIEEDALRSDAEDLELVALGETLQELTAIDAELARLVDCRFFAGLDERATADVLGLSERTVRRRWAQARAWIHQEMAQA